MTDRSNIRVEQEKQSGINKKGQPMAVDLLMVVETAGFEPASVSPLPNALHA